MSAIAELEPPLDLDEVLAMDSIILNDRVFKARLVLWPSEWFESGRGCEDPRVFRGGDKLHILYTGVASNEPDEQGRISYQAYAVVGDSVSKKVLHYALRAMKPLYPTARTPRSSR